MKPSVTPIPAGYHSVTPYLFIQNAADAIEFYKKAFNAQESVRLNSPDGKVAHAEIKIGDSVIMLADECPEMQACSPQKMGGTTISIVLYVENADTLFKQAVTAGAEILRPLQDQFYGDRLGMVLDPFGHQWSIATHIEDVPPEEVEKRFAAMVK